MDNQKTLLFAALAFVSFLIWQAWQKDYVVEVAPVKESVSHVSNSSSLEKDIPQGVVKNELETHVKSVSNTTNTSLKGQLVRVNTDVYELEINTLGAGLSQMKLLQYPVEKGHEKVIQLLNDQEGRIFTVESGLIAVNGEGPNHHSLWKTEKTEYTLSNGELKVPFYWENEQGLKVIKTYTFTEGSYQVGVQTKVQNNTDQAWQAREYLQLKRQNYTEEQANSFIYTYTGGILYTEENKYEKIDFDDMQGENLSEDSKGGWLAMIQHYFGVAWVPEKNNQYHYYTKSLGNNLYVMGAFSPNKVVEKGDVKTFDASLFAGPKIQSQLEKTAPGLELMVDYGKLTIIAEPIFWLLSLFYSLVGNWGWAIILVTLSIKALFFKLSEKSYRSMAHMKLVQPRIVALKERCGDDKKKLNQAMMELYKTEKINPLGGCLPILVQIPVFISLYWVLLESVELRQAPFMLWVDNLSAADPYFILPVVYGITMFLQQRLNPAPVDPMQKKMMQMLPIVFTGFFAFFPSGLVLYWIVNNVLTIAQQSYIMKRIESGKDK